MIELGIVLIMAGLMAWREYGYRRETAKLVNALISKNAQEARDLEIADKTEIKLKAPKSPNVIPLEGLSDDDWYASEIEGKKVR